MVGTGQREPLDEVLRLGQPFVPFDAAGEGQCVVDLVDVRFCEGGELLPGLDAVPVEGLLQNRADAVDYLQVVLVAGTSGTELGLTLAPVGNQGPTGTVFPDS